MSTANVILSQDFFLEIPADFVMIHVLFSNGALFYIQHARTNI
jgi:hypothetical protein